MDNHQKSELNRLVPKSENSRLLEAENLQTWLTTSSGTAKAVNGVSINVDFGETIAVVGESGSGKSMTMRSIMHILPTNVEYSSGDITFCGHNVAELKPYKAKHFWGMEMAIIPQDPVNSLNPVVRVGRQITEVMIYHLGVSRSHAKQMAVGLLEQVGISAPEKRLKSYPHELSGGICQRITIAMAISCSPKLLIADEATTALDVTIKKQTLDLLEKLQKETNRGMIMITHDLDVAASYASRIAVMYAGKIIEQSTTRDLFANQKHPYTQALTESIPKVIRGTHHRLVSIDGSPPDLTKEIKGCGFAPRCKHTQEKCLVETPELTSDPEKPEQTEHSFACFYPIGTKEGEQALEINLKRGRTAAGRDMRRQEAKQDGKQENEGLVNA